MEKIKKNRKLLSIFLIGEILIFVAIVIAANWSSERVGEPDIKTIPLVLVTGVIGMIGIVFIMFLYKFGKSYIKKATKGTLELIFIDFLAILAFGLVILEVLTNKFLKIDPISNSSGNKIILLILIFFISISGISMCIFSYHNSERV